MCNYFDRYYTKGVKGFNSTPYGWCCRLGQEVRSGGGCENFVSKRRTAMREKLIRRCLNDILTELIELRKVVESDEREKNL